MLGREIKAYHETQACLCRFEWQKWRSRLDRRLALDAFTVISHFARVRVCGRLSCQASSFNATTKAPQSRPVSLGPFPPAGDGPNLFLGR